MSKVRIQLFVVGERLNSCGKLSCYAVFATSSFHCFLAHVELEKELFAAWNQVPWPCKRKKQNNNRLRRWTFELH